MSQKEQTVIGIIFVMVMAVFIVGLVLLLNRAPDNRQPTAQTVETGENYVIRQISNLSGETKVEVELRALEGFPYDEEEFEAYPVIQDATGTWQLVDFNDLLKTSPDSATNWSYSLDLTGEEQIAENWILVQTEYSLRHNLSGWWGNASIGFEGGIYDEWYLHGLIFPVRKGYTTRVVLVVGKLEILVLNAEGSQALSNNAVSLFCTGKDLATPNRTCDGIFREGRSFVITDATGLATFYVGPETYNIKVKDAAYDGKEFFPSDIITMGVGEEKRVVVKYQP